MDLTRLSASLLPPQGRYAVVEVHEHLDSTNLRAVQLATPYAVVVAEAQSAGRGRLGRHWETPTAAAVTVSFTLPLEIDEPGWLPLIAGLAVADTITARCGLEAVLKWPNDVLLPADGHRKVCGVLCEIVPTAGVGHASHGSQGVVVVGIGLNVDQARDELPVPTATSLVLAAAHTGQTMSVTREELVVEIGSRLAELESHLRPGGSAAAQVRAAYRARCATIGARVSVSLPGGNDIRGMATAVTHDGALVVATDAGDRTFSAGDVTHVRPAATDRPGLA
ncbi:MAG: biotin--[acetyl-CoA-carboxylase] ligase [Dermatophilaceae bacterium]